MIFVDAKVSILVSDSNDQVGNKVKENKDTGTSSVSNMTTILSASKTRAHWTLALVNMLTSLTVVKNEL